MNQNILNSIAKQIMTKGKGILAADERPSSADKNLQKAGILPSEQTRKKYRELLLTTTGIENYLNAVILHDETFWQVTSSGKRLTKILDEKGIITIIKVDEGTEDLPTFPHEKITLGLDDLKDRLKKYYDSGAKSAKWRSVFKISDTTPTDEMIEINSVDLARYALFCQEENIVPIVEPEVLIDGDHSIEKAELITTKVLNNVFHKLKEFNVYLGGMILKTSMVIPGKESSQDKTSKDIADATVRTLLNSVPREVPGIVFLSGGQSPDEATYNLNEIAKKEPLPWELTFSYLRAIEGPVAEVWKGKDENVENARQVFLERLKLNTQADLGQL